MSDARRKWFTAWMPEPEAKRQIDRDGGNAWIWVVAIERFIWEQLFSPSRPEDLWLGPYWKAFGMLESTLRSKSSIALCESSVKQMLI